MIVVMVVIAAVAAMARFGGPGRRERQSDGRAEQ
jgi:hypothetical protein